MLELIRKYSRNSKTNKSQKNFKRDVKEKDRQTGTSKTDSVEKNEKLNRKTVSNPSNIPVSVNWLAFKASGALENDKKKTTKVHHKGKDSLEFPKNEVYKKTVKKIDGEDSKAFKLSSKSKEEKKMLMNCVALDCEMVGVYDGKESVLARVSVVDHDGKCIYDKFVKPKEKVVDFRTHVSGIRPNNLKDAEAFEVVQREVADILNGKVLVGHALKNDLKVLFLSHPPTMIRDTSSFKLFRDINNGQKPSLKKLAHEVLGITIQSGEHSSVEDARAAMQLYNLYQKEWEAFKANKKALRKNLMTAVVPDSKCTVGKSRKQPSKNPLMDEFTAF